MTSTVFDRVLAHTQVADRIRLQLVLPRRGRRDEFEEVELPQEEARRIPPYGGWSAAEALRQVGLSPEEIAERCAGLSRPSSEPESKDVK